MVEAFYILTKQICCNVVVFFSGGVVLDVSVKGRRRFGASARSDAWSAARCFRCACARGFTKERIISAKAARAAQRSLVL